MSNPDFDALHPRGTDQKFVDRTYGAPAVELGPQPSPDFGTAAYTDLEYFDRLLHTKAADRSDEQLRAIAGYEAEDDFMFTIASHANASAETLDVAAEHHNFTVRAAVIAHPAASRTTIAKLRDEAEADALRLSEEFTAAGLNPQTSHLGWEIQQNSRLAGSATRRLKELPQQDVGQ